MSLAGTYDDNNLFAKILRGEIPSVKVYEDDEVLAFMDVFPQSRGHVLVVPKNAKARNLLELPEDRVAPLKGSTSQLLFSSVALSGMPGQPNLGMLLERAVRNAVEGEW